jgi:hypothetical protein
VGHRHPQRQAQDRLERQFNLLVAEGGDTIGGSSTSTSDEHHVRPERIHDNRHAVAGDGTDRWAQRRRR